MRVRDGKKLAHEGIKVEFVGSIGASHCHLHTTEKLIEIVELFYDRGHHHECLSLSQELAAPGEMRQAQTFDFLFKNVEKQFESYQGINVKLRCVTCIAVSRSVGHTRSSQVLRQGDNIATNGGRHQGEGCMGTLIPNAPG